MNSLYSSTMLDKTKSKKDSCGYDVPDHFLCSISLEIMEDPVICADGHTYERREISKWLETNNTSPKTNTHLNNKTLIPNYALKAAINKFHLCNRALGDPTGPTTRNKTKKARQSGSGSDDSSVLLDMDPPTEADDAEGPHKMQLYVRTITNNTVAVKMAPSSTVMDLMEEIYKSEGVKVNQQRLIYAGKQLKAEMTLQHYGIQPSAVIHLILRLLGGQSSQLM